MTDNKLEGALILLCLFGAGLIIGVIIMSMFYGCY